MITLTTGFQWALNYGDLIYQEVIRLEDIVPRAGARYTFTFPTSDPVESGPVHLLWMPPESAENGWSEAPAEILCSQVVEGTAEILEPGAAAIAVDTAVDLPSAMRDAPADDNFVFPTFRGATAGENLWRQSARSRITTVGDLRYLRADIGGEGAQLEAILEDVDSHLVLRLHVLATPGSVITQLVNHRLTGADETLFRDIIASADTVGMVESRYLL